MIKVTKRDAMGGIMVAESADGRFVWCQLNSSDLLDTHCGRAVHAYYGYARTSGFGSDPAPAEVIEMVKAFFAELNDMIAAEAANRPGAPSLVINPKYAGLTSEQLRAAEARYDRAYNEGGEGYNPYRDDLYVEAA